MRWAVGALFPPRCVACRGYLTQEGALGEGVLRAFCASCAGSVYPVERACPRCGALEEEYLDRPARGEVCGACLREPPVWGVARAGFEHAGAVKAALLRAKDPANPHVASRLGRLLAAVVEPSWAAGSRLAPIPLAPERLAQRGFNQAAVVAQAVGAAWGVALEEGVLTRPRGGRVQRELSREERLVNLRGAYAASSAPAGAPPLILVDDVMTTGATFAAAAAALVASGWAVRGVLSVSRAR